MKITLAEKFAITFDGWPENSTHFIGIFAVFSSAKEIKKQHLLAFTPLLDETDLSADSQSALIIDTLELYGKYISTIKNSGFLRQKTTLRPVLRNDTRWSSTYMMLQRFRIYCQKLFLLHNYLFSKS